MMGDKDKCIELAFEGERLCKAGNYVGGVKYFESAVLQGTDDLSALSAIYSQLGNAYVFIGDFIKAVKYHQHDLTLARTIGDLSGEAKASSNLANTLKMMGKYDEAIACCQRHLKIAIDLCNKVSEAKALYSMANVYHVKAKQKCKSSSLSSLDSDAAADLNISISFYEQNLAIVRKLGDRAAQGKACGSLGNTHYLLGNCNEAVKYHSERLGIAKEFGDKSAQRRAYTNLGNTHILLGKYQDAAEFYMQTLSISRQLGDSAFEAQACYSLGSTYTLLGDDKRAIEYHLRHKQIAKQLNDRIGVGRACWLLSNSYISLGFHDKALECVREQLEISTELMDDAGKSVAERNLRNLVNMIHESNMSSDVDLPRVRRASMENMELLKLTPQQVSTETAKKKEKQERTFSHIPIKLFPEATQCNSMHDDKQESSAENSGGHTFPVLSANNIEVNLNCSNGNEKFFDLLTRLQCRRMDDQRAEMHGAEEALLNLPEFLQQEQNIIVQEVPLPDDVVVQNDDEHHQKMNHMISMLARSQSKRLNEQRVSLSSLPGLRITDGAVPVTSQVEQLLENGQNAADRIGDFVEEQEIAGFPSNQSLDENFFDNLIRCQGTRLNDQRSSVPAAEGQVLSTTIPDEDFFSLIVRMQSSRIDDQRCRWGTNPFVLAFYFDCWGRVVASDLFSDLSMTTSASMCLLGLNQGSEWE
uniref:G-protein-signaling modulator 2 n=1 Tax=Phallusia mammillata TaxID=59560 RepID=A0A6F9DDG0_9ASCI|nr:G-protein-signaling modulator 2 [Phallusia mammillata]